MSSVKRACGRPKGSLNKTTCSKDNSRDISNPYDQYAFDGYKSELKCSYSGEIVHSYPSIIKITDTKSDPSQWLSAISQRPRCFASSCEAEHFHCPLCPVAITQYEEQGELLEHFIKIHTHQHFFYSGHVIVLCNLGCQDSFASHYHCPKCGHTTGRSLHMRNHLRHCTSSNQTHCDKSPNSPPPKRKQRGRYKVGTNENEVHNIWDGVNMKSEPTEVRDEDHSESLCDEINHTIQPGSAAMTGVETIAPESLCDENQCDIIQVVSKPIETIRPDNEPCDTDIDVIRVVDTGTEETQYVVIDESTGRLISVQRVLKQAKQNQPQSESVQMDVAADEGMDEETAPIHPHISIVKVLEDLACCRCQTCCRLFHCPLCPNELYQSKAPSVIRKHLKQHFVCGVLYEGWTSMKCNLACDTDSELTKAHWHCPLCPQKKLHRSRLREHLNNHRRGRTRPLRTSNKNDDTHTDDIHPDVPLVEKSPIIENNQLMENDGDEYKETVNEVQSLLNAPCSTGDDRNECKNECNDSCANKNVASGHPMDLNQNSHCVDNSPNTQMVQLKIYDADSSTDKSAVHVVYLEDILSQGRGISSIDGELKIHKSVIVDEIPKELQTNNASVTILDHSNVDTDMGTREQLTQLMLDNDAIQLDSVKEDTKRSDSSNDQINTTNAPQVFQLVAGLLTPDLIQKVGRDMDELIQYLQDNIGISTKPQEDPEGSGYLLEGSWSQLDKSRIIMELIAHTEHAEEDLNINDIFLQAHKEYPDVFPIASPASTDQKEEFPDESEDGVSEMSHENTYPEISDCEEPIKVSHNEPCPFCLKRFRYKTSLFSHIINIHNPNNKPKINSEKWRTTLKRMTEVEKPECPTCGKVFTKLHHAQTHYSSNVCSTTRSNAYDLQVNLETGKYHCEHCSYTSPTPSVLLKHNKCKHVTKTIPCPKCDKMFSTDDILKDHMTNVHIANTPCTVCGVNVKMTFLDRHMHSHRFIEKGPVSQMKCPHCDYHTTVPQLMERHVRREHNSLGNECKECGMRFSVKASLYNHMLATHGLVPTDLAVLYGNCPHCNKNMLKRNIAVHVRLKHRGNRRYKCSTCYKYFQTKYVLDMHRQTHVAPDERTYRYICSLCSMGFQSKSMYMDHVRSHTDQRPYHCGTCGSKFRQKNVYLRHLDIHKPNRFSCQLCQQLFNSKYSVQQHMKRHHSENTGSVARIKSDLSFICVCGESFTGANSLQVHTKTCAIIERCGTQAQTIDGGISILAQDGDGSTVLLLDDHSLAQDISDIPTVTVNDLQAIPNITIQHLVEADSTSLTDPGSINIPLINSGIENIENKDGFLCGYCNRLFTELEDVQNHIVIEHSDQLPSDEQLHLEEH